MVSVSEKSSKFLGSQFSLNFFGFSILVFSILCFYSSFEEYRFGHVFNSDALGVASLFKDIFEDKGQLKDWSLAAAPTLFPDMSLYFLLYKIFQNNFLTITFVYALIQTIGVVLLMCYIYRKSFGGIYKEYSWLIPVFFSMFFLESYYFTHEHLFPYLISIYCFHGGAFVNALVGLSIVVSKLNIHYKWILVFLLSSLATFSDMLFLVLFVGPLSLTNIFFFKGKGLKFSVLVSIASLCGGMLGLYILNCMNGSMQFNNLNLLPQNNSIPSLYVFFDQIWQYINLYGFRSFQIAFAFVAILICLIALFRRKISINARYFVVFFIVFSIMVYAAPIIIGNYHGWDCIRYNIFPIYLSTVILAVTFSYILNCLAINVKAKHLASYLLIVIFFCLILFKFSPKGFSGYFSYYPPKVKALDSICEKHNFKRGISYYWYAKWATMFSRNNITILSVFPSTAISEGGGNIKWYSEGDFDFVIPYGLDSTSVSKYFVITDTFKIPDFDILRVKEFYFKERYPMPKGMLENKPKE